MKSPAAILAIGALVAASVSSAGQPAPEPESTPLLELSLQVVRSPADPSKLEARLLTPEGLVRSRAAFASNGSVSLSHSVGSASTVDGGRAPVANLSVEISIAAEEYTLVLDPNPAP